MKTRLFVVSMATAMALALPALAADSPQDFVNKAAAGGMFEVESSQVAVGRVQAAGVKDFAKSMISDHGAANAKLTTIATGQKLTVPKELDAKHKSDVEALRNGKEPVDEAYVQMQRDAHTEAVELFESYTKDGDNAELKAFATRTLPTLKMHQEMIEKIAGESDRAETKKPRVTVGDAPDPTPPLAGANSFTENQAKGRFEDAGFSDVSKLTKDDQGIWRGQASKNGKNTSVALDYKGNIVAGTN